jgi:hypothetical protein
MNNHTKFFREFDQNFRKASSQSDKRAVEIIEDYYEQQELLKSARRINFMLILALAVVILAVLFVGIAKSEITADQAVHCILGEARGEGYESMLAHAEAIRNRGHLGGVYGCRADFSKEMSYLQAKGIIEQAQKAWEVSQRSQTVKGADHWGSLKVDGKWIAEMERKGFVRTAVVRNTVFYKAGVK